MTIIQRPRFLSGVDRVKKNVKLNPYTRRPRSTLPTMWRTANFKSPNVDPRKGSNFELMQAIDEKKSGIKVQLSDKTLNQLLSVQVPDPDDLAWITEYKRRLSEGDSKEDLTNDPPFGRKQRTMTQKTTLTDATRTIDTGIQAVKQAIIQGSQDITTIGAALITMLKRTPSLTPKQQQQLSEASQSLKIPKDWKAAGLTRKDYDWDSYEDEKYAVLLYLMANIPPGFDTNNKFLVQKVEDGFVPVAFKNVDFLMRQTYNVLDIEDRTISRVSAGQTPVSKRTRSKIPAPPKGDFPSTPSPRK